MLVTETFFALILTSCILGDDNNMYCEDFQIKTYSSLSMCSVGKAAYVKDLLEFDSIDCYPVTYKGGSKI